jgi:hypothetical protein
MMNNYSAGERMKPLIIILTLLLAGGCVDPAKAENINLSYEPLCEVRVCNKLSRFSLDPFAHMQDALGKTCFNIVAPKSEAVVGRVLDSSSRWYQGSSINPTKRSVTRIESVGRCEK